MNNTSKNFDLREVFGDLLSQVRDRAMDFGQPRSAAQPTSEMIEVAVLAALSEEPKNATEVVSNVGLSSAGSWVPTLGKIHAALAALTEGKKVSAKTDGDRKVYTITKAGKAALKEAAANPVTESSSARSSIPNMNLLNCDATFLKSATKLGPVMLDVAQTGTHQQQQAAAAVLDEMRHQLHGILAGK
jgi:DNA-binding PadR family transcriptional regulator